MLRGTKCHLCYARIGHVSKLAIRDFNSCAAFAPFVKSGINARRNRARRARGAHSVRRDRTERDRAAGEGGREGATG